MLKGSEATGLICDCRNKNTMILLTFLSPFRARCSAIVTLKGHPWGVLTINIAAQGELLATGCESLLLNTTVFSDNIQGGDGVKVWELS